MERYPIKEKGCGPCLIINNYKFDRSFNREGTNADENRLRDVFQWLGCEVTCHRDATSSDIDDILRDLCAKDHSNTDVVVLCILSHGSLGKVYGVDDSSVEIQDILETLERCKQLVNKPKLIIIQACQGYRRSRYSLFQSDGPIKPRDSEGDEKNSKREYYIPTMSDFLVVNSTTPKNASWRHPNLGGYFIRELCIKLEEHAGDLHIVDIVTITNNHLGTKWHTKDADVSKAQIGNMTMNTLRKKLFFRPNHS